RDAESRAALNRIPGRAGLLERIRALSQTGTTVSGLEVLSSGRVFYLKQEPGAAQPLLCMRDSLTAAEHVLVDPTRGAEGASINWFRPSPDGRHVAYGISGGGSEDSTLRVIATSPPRELPIVIERARFNSRLAWHPDSHSFYYARIPEGSRGNKRYANIRVYRHMLGRDAAQDEIVFASGVGGARDVPEFAYPSLVVPLESKYAYARVADGVRRE